MVCCGWGCAMLDEVVIELVARFRVNRDERSFERLVEWLRPLVLSICRGYFKDEHDAEDAVQQTFVKLHTRVDQIRGNPIAWMSTTARRTCIDAMRARQRRQRLVENAAQRVALTHEGTLTWESARKRLGEAMAGLDPELRELVMGRFLHGRALREMAADRGVSVPTMSRRTSAAVGELAEMFRRLGYENLDDVSLNDMLELSGASCNGPGGDELRYGESWARMLAAADRESVEVDPMLRPIRVGVYVSASSVGFQSHGMNGLPIEWQMDPMFSRPGGRRFELIAIVEADYADSGPTESAIRDYDLTGGMIRSTDVEALRSLDVIIVGICRSMCDATLDGIVDAVRGGVGLIKQAWIAMPLPGPSDARVRAMSLSDDVPTMACRPGMCHDAARYRVLRRHPVFAGTRWGVGSDVWANGCVQCHELGDDVEVLIERVEPIRPTRDAYRRDVSVDERARVWPAMWAGRLGKGRAIATATPIIGESPGWEGKRLDHTFLSNALEWLAGRKVGADAMEAGV